MVCGMTAPRHQRIADYLRGTLAVQQRPKNDVAASIGMPQQTFSRKINGRTPFTLDELEALLPVLGLTWREVIESTEAGVALPPGVAREVERLEREAREQ